MTTDAILSTENGYYDITWTSDGDIATSQSFDTAILMSIFEEVRATADEIITAQQRRGWLGNESTPGFEQGSKAWQFEQERITGTVLAELGVIIKNGFKWFIKDELLPNVEVDTPIYQNGKVVVPITLLRDGSIVDRQYYPIWDNTGNSFNGS